MSLVALVLAAGEGTRMRSATPKVLHEVLGRPLLGHVLHAVSAISPDTTAVVTGAGREQVEAWLASQHPNAVAVEQRERKGTGHAVRVALEGLAEAGVAAPSELMVLTGDTPLLTGATLVELISRHRDSGAAATVLTAVLPDASGYGRILRDGSGDVTGIVEHRDADAAELQIREINSGIYVFDFASLLPALARLTTSNSQGEEYLTDVLALLRADGKRVAAVVVEDPAEVAGVNDRVQLAAAGAVLRSRINESWMRAGVTIVDPETTWIEADVVLAADCVIEPGCHLKGRTAVDVAAVIGPDTSLDGCVVGAGAHVLRSHGTGAHIGSGASVGPFTFLRPGAALGEGAKAGAYVEIKNAVIGAGSKVPHLSYVGDAEIGRDTNIGAAAVFVNYDGVRKHRTVVGDRVRIGSDTMLVAPLRVGDDAYTAAGSVITEDVPAGALGIGRGRQVNIEGWVERRRGSAPAATEPSQADNSTAETE